MTYVLTSHGRDSAVHPADRLQTHTQINTRVYVYTFPTLIDDVTSNDDRCNQQRIRLPVIQAYRLCFLAIVAKKRDDIACRGISVVPCG